MNENFYNSRKLRQVNVSGDMNKNGISRQNIMPQLVNLISPQIPASQSGNQTLINMGFNASPFLQYSIPNTFGGLNTMGNGGNVSYLNNMGMSQPGSGAMMNKELVGGRKGKSAGEMKGAMKSTSYPVRLLINSELVGPLIGRKGEKIKEITANSGAKIDIKRESVPYSQFGLNNYMFSGCSGGSGGGSRKAGMGQGHGSDGGESHQMATSNGGMASRGTDSQIVFIVSEPDKCSAAVRDIMTLCCSEAKLQGRDEPNLGLLAEDRFCARLIGKEGRFLNWVRCKSGSQVHVSNVPTITTLSEQPHIISLDRIISCRGGGLMSLLEAEKLISDKVRQCVAEDNSGGGVGGSSGSGGLGGLGGLSGLGGGVGGHACRGHAGNVTSGMGGIAGKHGPRLAKDDSFLPPRASVAGGYLGEYGGTYGSSYGGPYGPARMYGSTGTGPSTGMLTRHPNEDYVCTAGLLRARNSTTTGGVSGTSGSTIGSGIVHRANPNWPDNLKLDENLYVRIPQLCAGSIIGSEGKSVRRIMAETGTYIQISKSNLGQIESVPAVHTYRRQPVPDYSAGPAPSSLDTTTATAPGTGHERLITIKGTAPSQCSALTHIYSRVRICYSQLVSSGGGTVGDTTGPLQHQVRLWVLLRVPKLMLGRLIGKEGKVIRQLQLSSRTFLSFPRLRVAGEAPYGRHDGSISEEAASHLDENINHTQPHQQQQQTGLAVEDSDDGDDNQQHDNDVPDAESVANIVSNSNYEQDCNLAAQPTATAAMLAGTTANSTTTQPKVPLTVPPPKSHTNETLHNPDSALFGDPDLHPVEIFGTYESVEAAVYMIRRLVYSSIFSQFGPALIPGPTPQMMSLAAAAAAASAAATGHFPLARQSHGPHGHHHHQQQQQQQQQHHQQHQQILIPPPPHHQQQHVPPPLLMAAASSSRRDTDCHATNGAHVPGTLSGGHGSNGGNGGGSVGGPSPFFNTIPGLHSAAAVAAAAVFMQQQQNHQQQQHQQQQQQQQQSNRGGFTNRNYNNNHNNSSSSKKIVASNSTTNNQRSHSDHRSQSDSKTKAELDELPDNKKLDDDDDGLVAFEENSNTSSTSSSSSNNKNNDRNGDTAPVESDCATVSPPKCVLVPSHQDSPALLSQEGQFAQVTAQSPRSRDDLTALFSATSPCSYYTDCCSVNSTFLNLSTTTDELSFITAHDSFIDQSSSPFSATQPRNCPSPAPEISPSSPSPPRSPSPTAAPDDPSSHTHQLSQSPPLQQQQQQSSSLLSHWSTSPNLPPPAPPAPPF